MEINYQIRNISNINSFFYKIKKEKEKTNSKIKLNMMKIQRNTNNK